MTASKFQIHQITQKLKALDHEKDRLCESVMSYVDHISSLGHEWIDSEGQNNTRFNNVNELLGNSVSFLAKIQEAIYAGPGTEDRKELSTDLPTHPLSSLLLTADFSPLLTSATSSLMTSVPTSLSPAASVESSGSQASEHTIKTLHEQVQNLEMKVSAIQKEMKDTQEPNSESDNNHDDTTAEDVENIQIVGFTASVASPTTLSTDKGLSCFTDIISNIGDHYTPSTGVFTAPFYGTYLVSLTHCQDGDGRVRLNLIHESKRPDTGAEQKMVIGVTNTRANSASSSCLSVVQMGEGEHLYVMVCLAGGGAGICRLSSWSCCLIG